MNFEVLNDKNQVIMHTDFINCVPEVQILTLISKSGYKFRLDGKIVTLKKLKDYLKECSA